MAADAFAQRRGAGIGHVAVIETVAVGAADADGERARRVRGADRGNRERDRERKTPRNRQHEIPSPEQPEEASPEGFRVGEFMAGSAPAEPRKRAQDE